MKHGGIKSLVLFSVGYCAYIAIEVTYRGVSYPIMGLCGGAAVVLPEIIHSKLPQNTDLLLQGLFGSVLITLMELIIGEAALRTSLFPIMWDYSNVALNYDGVICLPFSILWGLLSIPAIILADTISFFISGEPHPPRYRLLGHPFHIIHHSPGDEASS